MRHIVSHVAALLLLCLTAVAARAADWTFDARPWLLPATAPAAFSYPGGDSPEVWLKFVHESGVTIRNAAVLLTWPADLPSDHLCSASTVPWPCCTAANTGTCGNVGLPVEYLAHPGDATGNGSNGVSLAWQLCQHLEGTAPNSWTCDGNNTTSDIWVPAASTNTVDRSVSVLPHTNLTLGRPLRLILLRLGDAVASPPTYSGDAYIEWFRVHR